VAEYSLHFCVLSEVDVPMSTGFRLVEILVKIGRALDLLQ